MQIHCAKSATGWPVVWANRFTSASAVRRRISRRWLTPTNIGPRRCSRICFYTALGRFGEEKGLGVRKRKFRFRNKLLSLDSTTISLCLERFPWAQFRRAKGGVKAHVLLDHDDYLPSFVLITEARRSDVKMAEGFPLNPGSIVAMDRGYNDYALFGKWTDQKIWFVTRLKDHAACEVVENGPLPARRNILADELIQFTGDKALKDCPCLLRRVVGWFGTRPEIVKSSC
jgi:hypothetical protein